MYSSTRQITEDVTKLQSDILLEDLNKNSLFKFHALSSKNKKLDTNNQYIVGAINELSRQIKGNRSSYVSSIDRLYQFIGNISQHPQFLDRVYRRANSLTELVLDIDNTLGQIDVARYKDKIEVFLVEETSETTFQLSKKPVDDIEFRVNGVPYYNSSTKNAYSINTATNAVTWLFTEDQGGFDLKNCEVSIKYQYDLKGDE